MSRQTIKEIFLILGFIALIGFGTYFLFSRVRPSSQPQEPITKVTLPPIPATSTLPQGDRLDIGTPHGMVSVKNFYKNAADRDADSVQITKVSEYDFTYFIKDSSFLITITSNPFDIVRNKAEQAFLERLGISRQEACQLSVRVGVPWSFNPDLAGKIFRLSFCEGNVQ